MAKEEQEQEDGWGQSADAYEKLFRPQFKELYKAFHKQLCHLIGEQIAAGKKELVILDYAAGVGEPTRSIIELGLPESKECQLRFVVADSSKGMMSIARKNLSHLEEGSVAVETRVVSDDPVQFFKQELDGAFDFVICSLGLMYMENEEEILREMRRVTKTALITSHWTDPKKNGMLRTLKSVGHWMHYQQTKHKTLEEFENNDHSFRFWRDETFSAIAKKAGWSTVTVSKVDMPMKFNSVLEIIGFSHDEKWYSADLDKAVAYANEYVVKELRLQDTTALFELKDFVLQNECAIVTSI